MHLYGFQGDNSPSSPLANILFALLIVLIDTVYIEDITRWQEDMNFRFEWQEQHLTSERSERVRYSSCHENIKFISSSCHVMFFLLYRPKKRIYSKLQHSLFSIKEAQWLILQ